MRLLIVTQTVDKNDPVLGFFHGWLREFSKYFERITVICLKEGKHELPHSVKVFSLGKESGASRLKYVTRFYGYIWTMRNDYDAVLVHMNQEYVLLGGKLWWLLGKPVYLWRNHYAGGLLTDIAAFWCRKVFCTSKYSYTAKYRKTVLMPVGIDTSVFKPLPVLRKPRSILSLGRIAPSKHVEVLLEALGILKEKDVRVDADIYGDPLLEDAGYKKLLAKRTKELHLDIRFHAGVPNAKTPELYSAHEIFVNCSRSGMYDKTIFEAATSGALVVASSRDFQELAGERFGFSGEPSELAEKIGSLLSAAESERQAIRKRLAELSKEHSLEALGRRLVEAIR
ncbi:glycosyltransferase family 4 protein [Candidatus Kaiserbacteria bacterium]|nr:glycosyltransferase family 4 protein [Candidatus Kaiserbacteria bacterium]